MNLTRAQLVATLAGTGIPVARANLFAPDELGGDVFGTVSRDWVQEVWAAFIEELQDNTPVLVDVRPQTYGVARRVPKYLLNGFCCRGHGLAAYAHGMRGFAIEAANSPGPLDHDALAFGFLHYTAEPRPENLERAGRHEILWGIDHDGKFFAYEPGDGDGETLTPTELASITLIFAQ